MNAEEIKATLLGKVVRISSTIGDWSATIEKCVGKDRWKAYDLKAKGYATIRTQNIVGLWEGDAGEAVKSLADTEGLTEAGEAGGTDYAEVGGESTDTKAPATDEEVEVTPPLIEAVIAANLGQVFIIKTADGQWNGTIIGRCDRAARPLGSTRPQRLASDRCHRGSPWCGSYLRRVGSGRRKR